MALITVETAKIFAQKSVAARERKRQERLNGAAEPELPLPTDNAPDISLACVRERLEALDQRMAKAQTDREWDNLSRAYERMFKVWCVLTRTPGPGQLKPQVTRAPRRAYAQQPMPAGWESTPDAAKQEQSNATQPNVVPKAPEASQ